MAIMGDPERYDEKFLQNYADINIIPAVKRVSGVGDCEVMGAKTYSMRIWLDPAKMKNYGLMPSDISAVLAEQNIEAAPVSSENRATTSMNTPYVTRDVFRHLQSLRT